MEKEIHNLEEIMPNNFIRIVLKDDVSEQGFILGCQEVPRPNILNDPNRTLVKITLYSDPDSPNTSQRNLFAAVLNDEITRFCNRLNSPNMQGPVNYPGAYWIEP